MIVLNHRGEKMSIQTAKKIPVFTKIHYKIIAQLIRNLNLNSVEKFHVYLKFCQMFHKDNSRFNVDLFIGEIFGTFENIPPRKEVNNNG